jgi:predicted phage terminase large subunit-like protein
LLHPSRLSEKVLQQLESDLGSFEYAGQYLQSPVPKGGGILQARWWKEWAYNSPPPCEYIIQVYDTAFKTGSMNDYTARTTCGIFRHTNNMPNIILLEAMNKRLTLPESREEAIEAYKQFDPDVVLIEDKASGISLIQELKRIGMRLKALTRGKGDDKVSRAHIASVMLEQGVVWYPKGCAWANEVIRQCASFPNAKHDDLTDTVTDALIFLRHYKKVLISSDDVVSNGPTDFKPKYGGHYG